ncbi:MAG: type II secretion system protein GspG [Oligoflexia bacterium]|nr:type II secretion system protein GspG [Oligoflexia bacterium]
MSDLCRKQGGYTILELTMSILLTGILLVGSISVMESSLDENRFESTLKRMEEIRNALIGDPNILKDGVRASFGIVGDIGALPASSSEYGLAVLKTKPSSYQDWKMRPQLAIASGWNGSYLSSSETALNYFKDAWNNPYSYTVTVDGGATLISYGADGIEGGDGFKQDIRISIPANLVKTTVSGSILNVGRTFEGVATVTIIYPDGKGFLTSTIRNIAPCDLGFFSFSNVIPFGVRALQISVVDPHFPKKTMNVVFSIDKANYVIPSNLLDINMPPSTDLSSYGCVQP